MVVVPAPVPAPAPAPVPAPTAASGLGALSVVGLGGRTFAYSGSGLLELDPQRGVNPFTSRIISVVGLRLGDEGKGRTVEEVGRDLTALTGLVAPIGLMLKANGGANSGHTVFDTAGNKYAFNLIPAGVVNTSIRYLGLGAQVVADPMKVWWEGHPLELGGFDIWNRLVIDERTMISDLGHRIRDLAREATRAIPVGSTGRGIAPAYEDMGVKDHLSYSIFLGDQGSFIAMMTERLERCCKRVQHEYGLSAEQWGRIFDYDPPRGSNENPGLMQRELRAHAALIERKVFKREDFNFNRLRGPDPFTLNIPLIVEEYWQAGQRIKGCIRNMGDLVLEILDTSSQYIISEHGQAIGLDVLHGDTPYTTSSNTTSSIVSHTARSRATISPHVLLVCKAYETAVGTHRLPCQIPHHHPLAAILLPQEKGATTGRQRLVSWPCAVQMGEALRWHGAHDFAINKIDQLTYQGDWCGPLKICVGYRTPSGDTITRLSHGHTARVGLTPIYLELEGWHEDISGMRSFEALPLNAQRYLATLYTAMTDNANRNIVSESLQQYPHLMMIGVGPRPGEVVRGAPLPQRLRAMACRYEIIAGRVVILNP